MEVTMLVEIKDTGYVNSLSNEAVSSEDIDAALEAGEKVFVSFGGDFVEVLQVEYVVEKA